VQFDQHITPEELEQIERYLQHSMPADEAASFSDRIVADEQLKEKVNLVRLTFLGINEAVLSGKLHHYHEELKPRQPARKPGSAFSLRWSLAAAILLLLSFATWWGIRSGKSNERLYSRYYKPDPGLMTLMSAENTSYEFEKAMVEYKNGDYARALSEWRSQLSRRPGNDTLLYFTGVAAQAAQRHALAIESLKPVADNRQSAFQNDACWYLGLAYVAKGEKQKARSYLDRSGRPERKQLLRELNE